MAERSAESFVRDILVEGLGASHIVVGYDFRFGKGRAGDGALLQKMGGELGFGVTIVDEVTNGGETYIDINRDLSVTQFYGMDHSARSAAMGGTQDNGSLFIPSSGYFLLSLIHI